MVKAFVRATAASIIVIAITTIFPTNTQPQPTSATQAADKVTECPPPTDKGAYHSRGYDKNGNLTCGFTYYNPCPYFEAAEAGTPECEAGKPTPEQLERWNPDQKPSKNTTAPETVKPNQCGGK